MLIGKSRKNEAEHTICIPSDTNKTMGLAGELDPL
jgi:hypothetical protein